MRRYNQPPISGQKYIHRPGAYGIFVHQNAVLLTAQNTKNTVEWQLPGGGIEQNESPLFALQREAYEETGWQVHITRKLGAWKQFTFMPEYDIHAEKICHIYLGRAIYPLGAPLENDHFPALVSPEIASEILVHQGDRDFMQQALRMISSPHRPSLLA